MKAPKFKVGDIAIALTAPQDAHGQPRIVGNEYEVKAVMYCAKCGAQSINIGLVSNSIINTICLHCCHYRQPHGALKFTDSKHFAKKEEMQRAIEECLAEENYETAAVLRDAKEKTI